MTHILVNTDCRNGINTLDIPEDNLVFFYEYCLKQGKFSQYWKDYEAIFRAVESLYPRLIIAIGEEEGAVGEEHPESTMVHTLSKWKLNRHDVSTFSYKRNIHLFHRPITFKPIEVEANYDSCELEKFTCPLPTKLVEVLCEEYLRPDDVVIDLFGGSCKIGKIAQSYCKFSMSFEIDKDIYDIHVQDR